MSLNVDSLKNAVRVSNLRNKILFTLLMFLVFRIGAHVPIPLINHEVLNELVGAGSIMDFFDTFSGGSFRRFTIFAMSITPYITASIIIQLLQVVIPSLERLAKEGDYGRKKIVQYIRYFTVVLGFVQGFGMTFGLRGAIIVPPGVWSWLVYLFITLILTAGTTFLMWLGEAITEKGIGNGISLIIFAGIASRIPDALKNLWQGWQVGEISLISIIVLAVIVVAVVAGIVYINEGQRRIQVQYAKRVVGRRVYGGQSSHIPLKVNQAGVIPIIFAISLVGLPSQIASWSGGSGFAAFVNKWMTMNGSVNSIPYLIVYALMIIGFTYFYTTITFKPMDVAENLKKYGGFIPGLRPGRPTSEYITKVLYRVTFVGAMFLALISILPTIVSNVTGFTNIYFGGTSLLIVVGVALDTMKQLESQLVMRHYQGFIK
ncbi:MAG: preprotein translocase subunit SecY [Peptococcaceae bacterium]|jgi:preprotein translocase subunit SecY|nr:preprotein translocase subunit SecY [Peptococcaceae bacterium]